MLYLLAFSFIIWSSSTAACTERVNGVFRASSEVSRCIGLAGEQSTLFHIWKLHGWMMWHNMPAGPF